MMHNKSTGRLQSTKRLWVVADRLRYKFHKLENTDQKEKSRRRGSACYFYGRLVRWDPINIQ